MPRTHAPPTVQSVDRAFAILDLVASGSRTFSAVAGQVDLPRSTVSRLLTTLEALRAIERTPDGYHIGTRVSDLVPALHGWTSLRTLVHPHLQSLAERLGEATGLAVPDGDGVRYVSHVESPNPVQVRDYTNLVTPAHIGSPGLAMMSRWDPERVDAYLARPLDQHTATTVVDPDAIRARLVTIRRDGYAVVRDEFADGISSVAACLLDHDGVLMGTIHAHGPSYRFPAEGMADAIGLTIAHTSRAILARAAA